MMNQNKLSLIFVFSFLSAFLLGCSSEDSATNEPQEVVRTAPKPRPKPKAKTTSDLKSELAIDNRILMEELESPRKEAAKRAVLTFFDAFLRADTQTLKTMMSFNEQLELDSMIENGLVDMMSQVSLLQLQTGSSPESKETVLAVYEIDLDYQVQVWHYLETNGSFMFTAAETPPNLVNRLSGNWLASYFDLKDKQTEIANQQDAESSYILAGEASSEGSDRGQDPGVPRGPGPGGPSRPGPGRGL